jgi:hypothetical protein
VTLTPNWPRKRTVQWVTMRCRMTVDTVLHAVTAVVCAPVSKCPGHMTSCRGACPRRAWFAFRAACTATGQCPCRHALGGHAVVGMAQTVQCRSCACCHPGSTCGSAVPLRSAACQVPRKAGTGVPPAAPGWSCGSGTWAMHTSKCRVCGVHALTACNSASELLGWRLQVPGGWPRLPCRAVCPTRSSTGNV